MKYQIGDAVSLQQLTDKSAPLVEMAAEMRRRQAPEQLIAEMQVDPTNMMAARDQGAAEPVKKIRDRSLQEQKRARLSHTPAGVLSYVDPRPPHRDPA